MKIGIVTFQREDNYGALLQCYALYTFLKERYENVEVLDYRNDYLENQYRLFPKTKSITKIIKSLIKCFFWGIPLIQKKRKFTALRDKIAFSSSYSRDDLVSGCSNYDIIISGSDQLWNPSITKGFDPIYFLDMPGDFYKASYAVSMGSIDNPAYLEENFLNLIKNFDSISVREKDAFGFLNQISNHTIYQDLDPTLLLSRKKWEEVIKKEQLNTRVPSKYIFLYFVQENPELLRVAEYLSKSLNIPVVCLDIKTKLKCKNVKKLNVGPLEFVWLIAHAETVVTSSFHATAFSSIFNKDIHLITHSVTGSRIVSLAEMYNIKDRIYLDCDDFINKYSQQKPIQYFQETYKERYLDSKQYLEKIINQAQKG